MPLHFSLSLSTLFFLISTDSRIPKQKMSPHSCQVLSLQPYARINQSFLNFSSNSKEKKIGPASTRQPEVRVTKQNHDCQLEPASVGRILNFQRMGKSQLVNARALTMDGKGRQIGTCPSSLNVYISEQGNNICFTEVLDGSNTVTYVKYIVQCPNPLE